MKQTVSHLETQSILGLGQFFIRSSCDREVDISYQYCIQPAIFYLLSASIVIENPESNTYLGALRRPINKNNSDGGYW